MDAQDLVAQLGALEDERFAAMRGPDWAALDRLLSEDLTYTHSSGLQDSKASYIQSLHDKVSVYHAMEVRERKVTLLGDVALVHSRVITDLTARGTRKTLDNQILAVWARQDGAWRLVAYQPTLLSRQQ